MCLTTVQRYKIQGADARKRAAGTALCDVACNFMKKYFAESGFISIFAVTMTDLTKNSLAMEEIHIQALGRTELAQRYFPYIQPRSAWLKLRAILMETPELEPLTRLRRRTFTPAEVKIIYQFIGTP